MSELPSLFGDLAPEPEVKKKRKAKEPKEIGLLDFLPDVREWRNPPLKYKIDASELTPEALSQKPGMEWIGQCQFYLVSPQSRDLTHQKEMLERVLAHFLSKAERVTNALCPSQLPADFDEPVIGLDLETTGLDTRVLYRWDAQAQKLKLNRQCQIVGVSLSVDPFEGYYFPTMHTEEDGVLNFDMSVMLEFLTQINQQFFTVIHNGQYDREVMGQYGVKLRPAPYWADTQILHYLYDVNDKRHGLKYLSELLLGRKMVEISELFGGKAEHISFELLSASAAYVYAGSDSANTLNLFKWLSSHEESPYKHQPIPTSIDHKISDTCRAMYRTGAPVNLDFYWVSGLDCIRYIDRIQSELDELAGEKVNLGSGKQMSELLFERFKVPLLPGMEKNKQGNYSVDEETLESLYELYPDFKILKYIVIYRKLTNYVSKFASKIFRNAFVDDWRPYARVQYSFGQTTIPTGRLNSNSSGSLECVSVKETKTGVSYKYDKGDGTCGFNSQGVASTSMRTAKARRIKSIGAEAGVDPNHLYSEEDQHQFLKAVARQ